MFSHGKLLKKIKTIYTYKYIYILTKGSHQFIKYLFLQHISTECGILGHCAVYNTIHTSDISSLEVLEGPVSFSCAGTGQWKLNLYIAAAISSLIKSCIGSEKSSVPREICSRRMSSIVHMTLIPMGSRLVVRSSRSWLGLETKQDA